MSRQMEEKHRGTIAGFTFENDLDVSSEYDIDGEELAASFDPLASQKEKGYWRPNSEFALDSVREEEIIPLADVITHEAYGHEWDTYQEDMALLERELETAKIEAMQAKPKPPTAKFPSRGRYNATYVSPLQERKTKGKRKMVDLRQVTIRKVKGHKPVISKKVKWELKKRKRSHQPSQPRSAPQRRSNTTVPPWLRHTPADLQKARLEALRALGVNPNLPEHRLLALADHRLKMEWLNRQRK